MSSASPFSSGSAIIVSLFLNREERGSEGRREKGRGERQGRVEGPFALYTDCHLRGFNTFYLVSLQNI